MTEGVAVAWTSIATPPLVATQGLYGIVEGVVRRLREGWIVDLAADTLSNVGGVIEKDRVQRNRVAGEIALGEIPPIINGSNKNYESLE